MLEWEVQCFNQVHNRIHFYGCLNTTLCLKITDVTFHASYMPAVRYF